MSDLSDSSKNLQFGGFFCNYEVTFSSESLQFGDIFYWLVITNIFNFVSFRWISKTLGEFLIVGFTFLCL